MRDDDPPMLDEGDLRAELERLLAMGAIEIDPASEEDTPRFAPSQKYLEAVGQARLFTDEGDR
jgi:hypothetical protein